MLAGIEAVGLRKLRRYRERDRDRLGGLPAHLADLQPMESDRHRLDALEIVERLGAGGAAIERPARRRAELGDTGRPPPAPARPRPILLPPPSPPPPLRLSDPPLDYP